ncbi:CopD family protein [Nocardia alni]|uniref:CopD family protein n=1 Tax=Nocardia alni TaxID=2815723 RepID=UPI001C2393E5|nr:CopD family protein [Nocardia alni]
MSTADKLPNVLNVTILAASAPPRPAAAMVLVSSVLYYLGLSFAAGTGLVLAVLSPVRRGGAVAVTVRRMAVPVAGLAAVTGVLKFVAQAAKAAKVGVGDGFSGRVLSEFVHAAPGHGEVLGAGAISLIRLGGYVLLVAALVGLAVWGARTAAWLVLVLSVVTASIDNLPFGSVGLAAGAEDVLTMVHVLGALLWVGGLVVLATAGLISRASSGSEVSGDGARTASWHLAWARFSVVAMCAVGMLVVTGSWLAWSHVGTPAQLLTTPYGRYLGIKLLLVLGMLAGGVYNVRVLLPAIAAARAREDSTTAMRLAIRHFPVTVAVEALLAVGVLAVVPFLAGSARSEAGWPAARSFDLTVFGTGVLLTALVAVALWLGSRTTPKSIAAEPEPASAG